MNWQSDMLTKKQTNKQKEPLNKYIARYCYKQLTTYRWRGLSCPLNNTSVLAPAVYFSADVDNEEMIPFWNCILQYICTICQLRYNSSKCQVPHHHFHWKFQTRYPV